jgi:hypothetical protein
METTEMCFLRAEARHILTDYEHKEDIYRRTGKNRYQYNNKIP